MWGVLAWAGACGDNGIDLDKFGDILAEFYDWASDVGLNI